MEIEKGRDKGKQKVRFDDWEVSAHMLGFGGVAWRTVASGQIKDGEATWRELLKESRIWSPPASTLRLSSE